MNKLATLYKSIDKKVNVLYVSPRIVPTAQYNPYIKLLYQDFLNKSPSSQNIFIRSLNPLIPIFIIKKLCGENSVLHCHWLEISNAFSLIITVEKIALFLLYSMLNGKIIWTIHNKFPHKKKFVLLNHIVYKIMAHIAVKIHVHSQYSLDIMANHLKIPKNKFVIVEHPLYPVTFVPRKWALKTLYTRFNLSLNPGKPIFLMYGFISEYKGIEEVLPLFIEKKLQLIIAGKCKKGEEEYYRRILKMTKNKKNIFLINQFISKKDEPSFFSAANYILFNLKDILSSGSIFLALSYKKEIIIPDFTCLKEHHGPRIHKFSTFEECKQIIQCVAHTYKSDI